MTDMALPVWAETTTQILAIIAIFTLIALGIIWVVYMTMQEIATKKAKDEYVKSLNQYEKSIIAHYDHISVNPWKRRKD